MPTYQITINGKKQTIDSVDADMPILWVLRDMLQMTGTKFGCGKALCGACTVHLNGTAIRSCSTPISAVGDQKIKTIEGLSENGDHPLQQAWVQENVPQCGYCQSGQIMNAAAFLDSNPSPSDEEIRDAMNGNICRCGTYNRIHKAIKVAAEKGGKS
ncbi:(2Fe-2S)-binding protein [Reichenbachiella sp. MALMAid0571]|uniref:(2Fe-2S)-binding protein n=1 Tax=Reichenbachiella sp. MALMAid0571 TaxID=3143939 RepID=UPI0032DF2D78